VSRPGDSDVLAAFTGDIPGDERATLGSRLASVGPAAIAFVAVLLIWEGATRLLSVQQFILPKPSAIVSAFFETSGVIWSAGLETLREALGGLLAGVVLAVATSLATTRWARLRAGFMPFAIAANSVPIVALAPIFNQWFSITSHVSKMAVVAVVVFFPVMINTARGLVEVDEAEMELMRSFAAKPRQVMWRIQVPTALPYFFSALKVASALSLIAAIVSEYFGGPQDVLGQYIVNRAQLFQFADAWAAIAVASLLGITMYGVILAVERYAMPWHVSLRGGGDR
jgi:NitT/TauT family transport system permease protein